MYINRYVFISCGFKRNEDHSNISTAHTGDRQKKNPAVVSSIVHQFSLLSDISVFLYDFFNKMYFLLIFRARCNIMLTNSIPFLGRVGTMTFCPHLVEGMKLFTRGMVPMF